MDLLKNINTLHWIFIGIFIVLYTLLIGKTIFSALKLRSSFRHIFIKFVIRSIYFSLILISIWAPTFGGVKKEIQNNSKDIFIAMDVTESMSCKDLLPSRLEKAKFELEKLVKTLHTDRIGLVIFNSNAYVHCPLTTDYTSFLTFFQTVKSGILSYTYTDLSSPLSFMIQKFHETPSQNAQIIILVSDGEDFGGRLAEIEDHLNQDQVTVVTVGVGSKTGIKIPHKNGFRKDAEGKDALSYLQSATMEDIAQSGNGKYFEISDEETQTQQLIEYINTLESKGEAQQSAVKIKANKYIYFLFLAFVFIIIDVLINVKIIRL